MEPLPPKHSPSQAPEKLKWYKTLSFRLGIVITFLICTIEAILLVPSYLNREKQLRDLNARHSQLMVEAPDQLLFSEQEIQDQLLIYSRNIVLLTLVIVFVVVFGTMAVYQWVVGKHIRTLFDANRNASLIPPEKIPEHEIGRIMHTRNRTLRSLHDYQADISRQLEEAKEQLVHSSKLSTIGEMSATIAHDLKNPLAIISLHASVLQTKSKKEDPKKEAVQKSAEKILFASERIDRLVSGMNRFSRSEVVLSEGVDLRTTLQNSLVLLEYKIRRNDIELKEDFPETLPTIWGDSGSLEQVFVNLCGNAIDAMETSHTKRLQIRAESDENAVCVSVCDTGCGIPEDKIGKVFDSFYTTKPAGKGTGLGLSICKQILEDHFAQIKILSEVGQGTEFKITLNQRAQRKDKTKTAA